MISPHPLPKKLPALVLVAFAVSPVFTSSARAQPRPSADRAPADAKARPSPFRRPDSGRPDPRYRPPEDFSELKVVAGEVAKATGREIRWHLVPGNNPGPLAIIRGGLDDCTIHIHPVAARVVPPNTWAFIFGHEFAHLVEELGTHSATNPTNELKADIAGARYAMAAGYRIEAFLGWVLAEPDQSTGSHGALHQRVQAIAARFRIPRNVIQAQAKRYAKYRASR